MVQRATDSDVMWPPLGTRLVFGIPRLKKYRVRRDEKAQMSQTDLLLQGIATPGAQWEASPLGNLMVKQSPVEGQAKTWHGMDETSVVSRMYVRTQAQVQMPVWRHGMYW